MSLQTVTKYWPVTLIDERYSSAVISAKRGEVIDAKAAAIILQQYFDAFQ